MDYKEKCFDNWAKLVNGEKIEITWRDRLDLLAFGVTPVSKE